MPNGSKYHRRDANIYSIECRTGDEAGGCSGLERRGSHKAEGLIVSKSGWVHIEFGDVQTINKGDECFNVEKREGSGGARLH
jgi:hypothetical protein